jgi:hypothetical protein
MKQVTRYVSRGLLAITLSLALIVAGCPPFATVMQKLKQYVPIGLQAFAGVVAIINPPVGSALALAAPLVNKAWSDLSSTIDAYNAAPAADKSSALGATLTALDALEANLKQSVTDLGGNPSSPEVQAAQAALLLLTTTLTAIESQLVPPQAPPALVIAHAHARIAMAQGPRTVMVAHDSIVLVPAKSPSDFCAQYNRIMASAGHPDRRL